MRGAPTWWRKPKPKAGLMRRRWLKLAAVILVSFSCWAPMGASAWATTTQAPTTVTGNPAGWSDYPTPNCENPGPSSVAEAAACQQAYEMTQMRQEVLTGLCLAVFALFAILALSVLGG
jgi:hypothetical protein